MDIGLDDGYSFLEFLKSILIFCIESKEELDVLEFFFQLERSILRDDFDLLIQFLSSTIGN